MRHATVIFGPTPLTPGRVVRPPAVSNTERQREFRERNPGYYGRLKARERAACNARVAERRAAEAVVTVEQKTPLTLPAPVQLIEIPGINALPTRESIAALRAQLAVA